MSYTRFLVLFLLPPLVLLSLLGYGLTRADRRAWTVLRHGLPAVGGLVVVALLATTGWDSWLIRSGVWSYQPDAITGSLWRVPFEEYGFIAIETAVVGLWTLTVAGVGRRWDPGRAASARWRGIGCGIAAGAGVLGVVAAAWSPHAFYLGAILGWVAVPLAAQCAVGADQLVRNSPLWVVALGVPVVYFWAIDRAAIGWGVWRLSPARTLNVHPGGLPVEEATFFLATSMLIVNSVLLVMDPVIRARLGRRFIAVPRLRSEQEA